MAQKEAGEEASFSDIFGRYIRTEQDGNDAKDHGEQYDVYDEIEKLRRIGPDLFGNCE